MEQVPPKGLKALQVPLSELDEVIHEHVSGTDRPLRGAVGHRRNPVVFRGPRGTSDLRVQGGQGEVGLSVVRPFVFRVGVLLDPVAASREVFEPMRGSRIGGAPSAVVGQVGYGLGHSAERGWRLDPTHGAGHRDRDQLFFAFVSGEDDRQTGAILGREEEAIEPVLDVVLAKMHRAVPRVRVTDGVQDPRQGSPELHGFRGSVRKGLLVHGRPGVVAEKAGLAFAFLLDGGRRKLKMGQGTHDPVGQYGPEPVIDELGHFFA
jgi:hypothetical protein